MKRRVLLAIALVSFGLGYAAESLACGDKLLVVGRGARYQRGYVAVYPASVLVVDLGGPSGNDLLLPLRRAGHRVDVVHDSNQLRQVVAANGYDVVLADWSQASELKGVVASAAPSTVLIPVLDGGSPSDMEAATKLYGCPLEAAKKKLNRSFLARLDEVIEAKRKSKPLRCSSQ